MACLLCAVEKMNLDEEKIALVAKSESIISELLTPQRPESTYVVDESKTEMYDLQRGGWVVTTESGPVQFGIPPETVKDSMVMGKEVPSYFVVPSKRFDYNVGISIAEFEFPAYFNFFVKRRKITLICSESARVSIRSMFQETLLGPDTITDLEKEFHHEFPRDQIPNLAAEFEYFAKNPFNREEALTIDLLLQFRTFDEVSQLAYIDQNVSIRKEYERFVVLENDVEIAYVADQFDIPVKMAFSGISEKSEPKEEVKALVDIAWSRAIEGHTFASKGTGSIRKEYSNVTKPQVVTTRKRSHTATAKEPKNKVETSALELQTGLPQPNYMMKPRKTIAAGEITGTRGTFVPPEFGVTVLGSSHGFDPTASTSGYIFWINSRGIMVDPPPFSTMLLSEHGISSKFIGSVIITHCHADHDAGTFQKILSENKIEIITTPTIMSSFVRKFSALTGEPADTLKRLFKFRPVLIGAPLRVHGGVFNFFYSIHTIPSLGFEIKYGDKSLYFSGDTLNDPTRIWEMYDAGILPAGRRDFFLNYDWHHDLILHEAGVPPIHTPIQRLMELPFEVKERILVVHVATKDIPPDSGIKQPKTGIENTIDLNVQLPKFADAIRILDIFANMEMFQDLSIRHARDLLAFAQDQYFIEGSLIIEEDTVGYQFYIIQSGIATVKKGDTVLRRFGPGDFFGESALITEEKRLANVFAESDWLLLTIQRHDFQYVFRDCPEIIEKMHALKTARVQGCIAAMNNNSIFSELSSGQKTQFESIFKSREYTNGEYLWQADSPCNTAFLLGSGSVYFKGYEQLEPFSSGAFFSDLKAMQASSFHYNTLVAGEDCSVYYADAVDFLKFVDANPGVQMSFLNASFLE